MIPRIAILFSIWGLPVANCIATIFLSPEIVTARAIASWIETYHQMHNGALPSRWSDFSGILEEPIEDVMRHAAPTKRYAFVSPPFRLPTPHEGNLVAINRSAIYDTTSDGLRGPGRYIVFRNDDKNLGLAG